MTADEIVALVLDAQSGKPGALDACVEANTGLVWSMVHRFKYSRYDAEDLFQIGCVGLMKAIQHYDASYGVMFSTYAVPMILGEIKKYFREGGDLRLSRSMKERYLLLMKAKERWLQEHQSEPTPSQLAEMTGMDVADAVLALEANQYVISLDEPLYQKDGSSVRIEDTVAASGHDPIIQLALRKELGALPQREAQLIYMRYTLEMNQSEIAKRMGMTQVQISRLEKKIVGKLRRKLLGSTV